MRTITQPIGRAHNHLDNNYHLSNKKALFYNIRNYCEANGTDPFEYIPITYHVIYGLHDKDFLKFKDFYYDRQNSSLFYLEIKQWENLSEAERVNSQPPKNIYIIKPGEVTNRGHGITVMNDITQIQYILN